MSMFRAAFEGRSLSQTQSPPTLGPGGRLPDFVVPPRPPRPTERPETTTTMPPDEVRRLKELGPFADLELDDLCFFLRQYRQESEKPSPNEQEKADAMAAAKRVLEKNKAIGWNLVDFASKYCDAGSHIVNDLLKTMDLSQLSEQKPRVPTPTPGATPRPATATPGVTSRPLAPVPTGPVPMGPQPFAPRPATPTSFSLPTPNYMDTPTPATPQYSQSLQQQLQSYSQNLDTYYNRPPSGTPVPGTPVATPGGPGRCPTGQFWDGRKCRGSVDTSAAGLISAAGGGGATMAPGAFNIPGGGFTSVMGRYRVVNV